MTTVIHLPVNQTYYLKAWGGLTGSLDGNSNMNGYIALNGDLGSNHQVPLTANNTGVVWPKHELAAVSGDVVLELLFRPSAGTLTIEAGYWNWKARRVG